MLIICPKCETSYAISAASIGEGRYVRCTRCQHQWHAKLEETHPATQAAPATPKPAAPAHVTGFARFLLIAMQRLTLISFVMTGIVAALYFQPFIVKRFPQISPYLEQLHLTSTQGMMLENIHLQELTPAGTQNTEIWLQGNIVNHDNVARALPLLQVTLLDNEHAVASEMVQLDPVVLQPGSIYTIDHKLLYSGRSIQAVELDIGNKIELWQRRH